MLANLKQGSNVIKGFEEKILHLSPRFKGDRLNYYT
jgi:hypothetical protein